MLQVIKYLLDNAWPKLNRSKNPSDDCVFCTLENENENSSLEIAMAYTTRKYSVMTTSTACGTRYQYLSSMQYSPEVRRETGIYSSPRAHSWRARVSRSKAYLVESQLFHSSFDHMNIRLPLSSIYASSGSPYRFPCTSSLFVCCTQC